MLKVFIKAISFERRVAFYLNIIICTATYGSFQVELWRLRHTVARATVDILRSSESTISDGVSQANIRILTEIVGVGPTFRLYITLHNISTYKMASNLQILLHADRRHFIIAKSLATVSTRGLFSIYSPF